MDPFSVDGTFSDRRGTDRVVWEFVPYTGPLRRMPSYTIRSTVRGHSVWGFDMELLGLDEESVEDSSPAVDMDDCVLSGTLPIRIRRGGQLAGAGLQFEINVPPPSEQGATANRASPNTTLSVVLDGVEYRSESEWFEDCFAALLDQVPDAYQVECCWTCLYSDISPGGYSGMAMNCHRDSKEQYLSVQDPIGVDHRVDL